ncbi:MAG: hypothetical protein L3J41_09640 [Melioribacteraceae bacterium]|nr:hypothetical protein [Melioribacteraceae bacterium]
MKQTIILLFLISSILFAQEFKVNKITGTVLVQKGIEDSFALVKTGDILNGDDLIVTEENSFIQLEKENNRFVLKANSALGLNHIRKISVNDLLLALAMEDIRNIPTNKQNGIEKNTAVYGENISTNVENKMTINKLGKMKINGAKQLAENGFNESAIIVSKDTFRKYPSTKSNFDDRVYFANLLEELNLLNETLDEYNSISKLSLTKTQQTFVQNKIEEISIKQ